MNPVLKTAMVTVPALVAYLIIYVLGSMLLTFKNNLADVGDGTTIWKLIQDGAVAGMAAYGALWLAETFFANIRTRMLAIGLLALIGLVTVGLWVHDAEWFIPQGRQLAFRAAVTSGVVSFVSALIGTIIYLRQHQPSP